MLKYQYMKKNIFYNFACLFFFLFCVNVFSQEISKRTVTIVGDQWCPYVCSNKGDYGFSVELVKKVLDKHNYKTVYMNSNFVRLVEKIEKGEWDIVTGTNKSFSPGLLISKVPVAFTKWVFVTKNDLKWEYKGPDSLKKLRLGTVAGYTYSKELMKYIEKNKDTDRVSSLFSTSPQESNIKMLVSGRIDVFIEDKAVIDYWLEYLKIDKSKIRVAGVDFEAPLYCGLNKKDQKLADLIDKGIKEFSKTKEFERLLKKYKITNYTSEKLESKALTQSNLKFKEGTIP